MSWRDPLLILGGAIVAAIPAVWSINRAWREGFDHGYIKAMWDSGEMKRRLAKLDDPEASTNLSGMTREEVRRWLASL